MGNQESLHVFFFFLITKVYFKIMGKRQIIPPSNDNSSSYF